MLLDKVIDKLILFKNASVNIKVNTRNLIEVIPDGLLIICKTDKGPKWMQQHSFRSHLRPSIPTCNLVADFAHTCPHAIKFL
jgi:hypothetical protein